MFNGYCYNGYFIMVIVYCKMASTSDCRIMRYFSPPNSSSVPAYLP